MSISQIESISGNSYLDSIFFTLVKKLLSHCHNIGEVDLCMSYKNAEIKSHLGGLPVILEMLR